MYLGVVEALCAFVFLFCSVLCYFYWKCIKPFRNFPTKHIDMEFIFTMLTGKYPQNLSFGNYFFHKAIETGKRFQREGLCIIWMFQPIVFLCNDTYTKILLNSDSALDKPIFYEMLSEFLGKGLSNVNGCTWKKRRKMIDPAFRPHVLKSQIPVFNKVAKGLVRQLSEASNEPTVDLLSFLKVGALKAFSEISFGINSDDPKYDTQFIKTTEDVERIASYTTSRYVRPWLYWKKLQIFFKEGRMNKDIYKPVDDFLKYFTDEILERTLQTSDEEADNKTFVRILIDHHLKDPSFTKEDLYDEVKTFFVASLDTTANALLWCLFMLAVHPEVQENVFQELESLTENSEGDIRHSDLNELRYLDSVIKETMRLYQVLPLLGRKTTEDIEFGKYKVPKNTTVGFSSYLVHRDPDIYPDPEKFDHERFYNKTLKHPWAYIPFAEGIRSCIGKNFALMEMKIILGHILRNFEITSLDKREDVGVEWNVVLTPQKPIRFRLFQRKSEKL